MVRTAALVAAVVADTRSALDELVAQVPELEEPRTHHHEILRTVGNAAAAVPAA
jgi:hypothetical protein